MEEKTMEKLKQNNFKKKWKRLDAWAKGFVIFGCIGLLISIIATFIAQRSDIGGLVSIFVLLTIILITGILLFGLYIRKSSEYWKVGLLITIIYFFIGSFHMFALVNQEGSINSLGILLIFPFGIILEILSFNFLPSNVVESFFVMFFIFNFIVWVFLGVVLTYVLSKFKRKNVR